MSTDSAKPKKIKLRIAKEGELFAVYDQDGVHYGPSAASRKEIEQILKDWKGYYGDEAE